MIYVIWYYAEISNNVIFQSQRLFENIELERTQSYSYTCDQVKRFSTVDYGQRRRVLHAFHNNIHQETQFNMLQKRYVTLKLNFTIVVAKIFYMYCMVFYNEMVSGVIIHCN